MDQLNGISVGQVIPEFMGMPDQVRMSMSDNGYFEIYVINRGLTQDEISEYQAGKPARFGLVHIKGIVLLLIKFGKLNMMDVPYNPNVGNMPLIIDDNTLIKEGEYLMMSLVLVESSTGEVKHLRAIGIGSKYSNALFKALRRMKADNYPLDEYNNRLNQIYSNYSTNDLEKYSIADFRVREE